MADVFRAGRLLLALLILVTAVSGQTAVILVGTGGPELTAERRGEATLIESGGQDLLFDAGRGVLDGLYRARVPPQRVTRVFLTHLHSDHIEGLPGLWMTPWFLLGRTQHLEVWGPAGTRAMVDGMRFMFAHDLEHRPNGVLPREALDIVVHEIAPGLVYESPDTVVRAIAVEHADGDPAFAYEVTAGGQHILLTGDCNLSGKALTGAGPQDLVISNVAAAAPPLRNLPRLQPILAKLMSPEQAAVLFRATRPRLAVYSHIVTKGLSGPAGDREILGRTRAAGYAGPLRMGEDGLRIQFLPGSREPLRVKLPLRKPPADLDGPDARF